MQPDMMLEITETEQRKYSALDASTVQILPNLPATMPEGRARKVRLLQRHIIYLESLSGNINNMQNCKMH